jgi:CBS domain-containing protein
MEVREGMSTVVVSIGPDHTLREAARRMTEKTVGSAVVVDPESPGPSIITERDILTAVASGLDLDVEKVGAHTGGGLITAAPEWSLERAADQMARSKVRHLLVVDGGELVGVLSMRDIVACWTREGATSGMTP